MSVAVPVPYLDPLTYNVPTSYPDLPPIGARVRVPIGSRTVVGCVVAHATTDAGAAPRDVAGVLDEEPFLPPAIVDLCGWVADYYMAGFGDAIGAAMPPGSRRSDSFKTQRVVWATSHGLSAVEAGSAVAPKPLGGEGGSRADISLTAKQQAALEILAAAPGGLSMSALRDRGVSSDLTRRLAARGLVAVRAERDERDPFERAAQMDVTREDGRLLTEEQQAAVDTLVGLADAGGFRVALLHGVTGSGKTEIYLRLADRVCGSGRQVLLMVPEIALTPSVSALFRSAFGTRVAIQHSALSNGERHDQWQRIRRGEVDVVVGTRSAVFAPLANPGLIIVDEEHDTSYKQEESPRYHGRDVAIVRGRNSGALVVLGSATPSMESYQNAVSGKYSHVTLERRVLDRPLAAVRLVNMREEYAEGGPDVVISRALGAAIEQRLARREQVLVLLNRRGHATAVFCRQCGDTFECPNCSVSLTVHRARAGWQGRCHYCNYSMAVPTSCRKCAAPYLETTGFGTEKIEQRLRERFPAARVGRVDRDSVRRKGALTSLLSKFATGEIDVLVGTQMIAKGHDFPRVTLVGVISADVGLGLADFRAAERTFQLLTQVAGRAGRGERSGEAIVQTLYPGHYSIQAACRQDYPAFFERELAFRRGMRYPPHVAMINAVIRGRTFAEAMHAATDIVRSLEPSAERARFLILGPAPAPLGRLRGEHRVQFFLKGTRRADMRTGLKDVLAQMPDLKRRVTVDVDPLSVL
ncbi:MAG: primosomal protein N' [Acidobacteria bacterium]|nr:primosomal protein N' [Acidobacteriota bacterium]